MLKIRNKISVFICFVVCLSGCSHSDCFEGGDRKSVHYDSILYKEEVVLFGDTLNKKASKQFKKKVKGADSLTVVLLWDFNGDTLQFFQEGEIVYSNTSLKTEFSTAIADIVKIKHQSNKCPTLHLKLNGVEHKINYRKGYQVLDFYRGGDTIVYAFNNSFRAFR